MIRDLALEAIKFVDDHDLITVPHWRADTLAYGDDDPGAAIGKPRSSWAAR